MKTTITLKFHPQNWVGDYAETVAPPGPDTWEVPLAERARPGLAASPLTSERSKH